MNKDKLLNKLIQSIELIANTLNIHPLELTYKLYKNNDGEYSKEEFNLFGGFNFIKQKYFSYNIFNIWSEIYKAKNIKQAYDKLYNFIKELDLHIKEALELTNQLPKLEYSPNKYIDKKHKISNKDKRYLTLNLSDLHIGSDLSSKYSKYNYGKIEEARALASVVRSVCTYKLRYRKNTILIVNILGDIIQNILHDLTTADYLHVQTTRAIWLLTQAIKQFSMHFPQVIVNFAVGNHGRDIALNKQRAVSLKFNGIETTVYYAVKIACQDLKNVKFNQTYSPFITYKTFDYNVYATHGDTHLMIGNPGKNINIEKISNKINMINAAQKHSDEYDIFIIGHVHHPLITTVNSGAFLIINGTLSPPDDFAQSIGINSNQQIQIMYETVAEHAIGDIRFIDVTNSVTDSSLDKIIIPYTDLNN